MKHDTICTYDDRREEILVSYIYDEIDPAERQAFERHLPACPPCRTELEALGDVRASLRGWSAPEVADGVGGTTPETSLRLAGPPPLPPPRPSGWRVIADAPLWMQAAAAMLVVAASLGLANINLTVSRDGVALTTGWLRAAATVQAPQAAPVQAAASDQGAGSVSADVMRAELTAMEARLRAELKAQPVAVTAPAAPGDEALMKRVRALLEESERRQQSELALRVAEVARESQTQRQADLVKIDRSLGLIQNRTGVEVMRTQQQLNSLAQRVSQQR